jgi:hypothetical protein
MRWWGVVAAVTAIGVGDASQAPPPVSPEPGPKPQSPTASNRESPKEVERGTYARPVIIEISPTANDRAKAEEEAKEQKEGAAREDRLVIWTGVLTIATVILGFFTALLWWTTRQAMRDTSKGIAAATTSADAALAANAHAAEVSELQLRPYISFDEYRFIAEVQRAAPDDVLRYQLVLVWRNSGQTPATRIKTWLSVQAFDPGTGPAEIDFPDLGDFTDIAAPKGPGTTFHSRVPIEVSDLEAAAARTRDVYYWGWVEYSDQFASTVRHRTEICALIRVGGEPRVRDAASLSDVYRTRFNAMDTDCVHAPKTS